MPRDLNDRETARAEYQKANPDLSPAEIEDILDGLEIMMEVQDNIRQERAARKIGRV